MSTPASATPQGVNVAGASCGPYEDRLTGFCRLQGFGAPAFQIVSDRRGSRTAWSCTVTVRGTPIKARFWYDGQRVSQAREDAAEMALQAFGVLPTPPGPQAGQYRQQQQTRDQYYGAVHNG